MSEHFTKNTIEAAAWCKVCAKETPHSVFGGRLGSCLYCIKRLGNQASKAIVEPQPEQQEMFGGRRE